MFFLRDAAARVSLGVAPRAGSARVLDGRQIRQRLEELAAVSLNLGARLNLEKEISVQVPERIVVRRAGAMKSCAEIASLLAGAAPTRGATIARGQWREDLNCAAARDIAENAALELSKTAWNAASQRWEFTLRCARPEECVPFLVWTREEKMPPASDAQGGGGARSGKIREVAKGGGNGAERLVKPGQTATLTWEQAGLRIVLPVTCLDAGGLGQFVRVRFKNAARTLRAEVMGKAILRASL